MRGAFFILQRARRYIGCGRFVGAPCECDALSGGEGSEVRMNRWLHCAVAVLAVSMLMSPAAAGERDHRPARTGHEQHRPAKTPKAVQPPRQETGVPCQRYGVCSSNGCFPWPPGCQPNR
jgi:hypothetical protein